MQTGVMSYQAKELRRVSRAPKSMGQLIVALGLAAHSRLVDVRACYQILSVVFVRATHTCGAGKGLQEGGQGWPL